MKKLACTCIIDDDPIFVYGTKRIMEESDFTDSFLIFTNGEEAIEGLQELSSQEGILPDVIFLDLNMPIMNGWEFLDHITLIPNNNVGKITIFIITSSIDSADVDKAKTYEQVSNYFIKPITAEDLQDVLKTLNS
jgi:CheY-like chemotaxis protein